VVVDSDKASRIRARRAAGETYKEIAKGERVSFSEIAEVVKGKPTGDARTSEGGSARSIYVDSVMRFLGEANPELALKRASGIVSEYTRLAHLYGIERPEGLDVFYKKWAQKRYDDGYALGEKENEILIPCPICGVDMWIEPGSWVHDVVISLSRQEKWLCQKCTDKRAR